MSRSKLTPPSALRTVWLDIMDHGRFLCQVPYVYNPLFPASEKEILAYIRKQRPSLAGRKFTVAFSDQKV